MWCLPNHIFKRHWKQYKQYLEIAAIWPHRLSGPINLQITVKYFSFQTTVIKCKSILWKTFAQLLMANLDKTVTSCNDKILHISGVDVRKCERAGRLGPIFWEFCTYFSHCCVEKLIDHSRGTYVQMSQNRPRNKFNVHTKDNSKSNYFKRFTIWNGLSRRSWFPDKKKNWTCFQRTNFLYSLCKIYVPLSESLPWTPKFYSNIHPCIYQKTKLT